MATLKVVRPGSYIGMLVKINILIDRKKLGKISNGKEQEFDLPAGSYVLSARDYAFSGSNDYSFTIGENEIKTLSVKFSPTTMGIFAVTIGMGIGIGFGTINGASHSIAAQFTGLAILLVGIAGFIVFRKKFIEVKEW